jgi:hypothetical protein
VKACWIDEGQDADYSRLTRHGIGRLLFSPRVNQGHSRAQIDEARAKGFEVGIYRVPEWDPTLEGAAWATMLSKDVTRLGGDGTQVHVQADIETHNTVWLAAFLLQWRKHRAKRDTSVTTEGFQGGLLVKIRPQILDSNVTLVPQAYGGDMQPWDTHGTVLDLIAYGFPLEKILPFYDAADLRRGWSGYCFTQQRLP